MAVILNPIIDIPTLNTWFLLSGTLELQNWGGWVRGRSGVEGWDLFVFIRNIKSQDFHPCCLAEGTRLQPRSQQAVRICVCLIPHIWKLCGMRCGSGIHKSSPSWKQWRVANHAIKVLSSQLQVTSSGSRCFLRLRCATAVEKSYSAVTKCNTCPIHLNKTS